MKKIMIAVPCMDMVYTQFVQSLLELKTQGLEIKVAFVQSSLIYDARNQLINSAIKGNFDYILWIDSDMLFEPDALLKLIADDKDFVCGLFFRRRPDYSPAIYKTLSFDAEYPERTVIEKYPDYPKEGLFEVEACGFAYVLQKVDMLRDILIAEKGLAFSPLERLGEDLTFCVRARRCGYKIYCDPSVKIGHIGHVVITDEYYEAWRRLNENSNCSAT